MPASPMRQSTANTMVMARMGANTLLGSSGMKCAMASSSWFTLSTKRFLNVPVGVSTMTPMGTRDIFSAICSRMVRKALKAMPWLIIDDRHVSTTLRICPPAAASENRAAISSVSVPSMRPAASKATTTYGTIPAASPKQARTSESTMRALSGRMK